MNNDTISVSSLSDDGEYQYEDRYAFSAKSDRNVVYHFFAREVVGGLIGSIDFLASCNGQVFVITKVTMKKKLFRVSESYIEVDFKNKLNRKETVKIPLKNVRPNYEDISMKFLSTAKVNCESGMNFGYHSPYVFDRTKLRFV